MVNSFVAQKDLDTEMTVVRNEFESGENNPQRVLWGRLQAAAYDWHNYGNPRSARARTSRTSTSRRLQAFYELYYQPDNAVLIVAGHFDPDRTLAQIAKTFGPIPRPTRTLPALYTKEPVQDGERTVTVRRVGGSQFVAALVPHGARRASGRGRDGRAGRGDDRRARGPAVPGARRHEEGERRRSRGISCSPIRATSSSGRRCRRPIRSTPRATRSSPPSRDVKAKPITDAEVDRVRAKALRQFDETFNDPQQLGVAISESIAIGDWRLFFLQRDHWRKVTRRRRAARGARVPEAFEPDGRPVHSRREARSRARRRPPSTSRRWSRTTRAIPSVAAGESFEPTPANLEARTQRFALPNGMKVTLLPKKTRGETVQFQMRLHHGDETSLKGMSPRGGLAASMLSLGTKKRDRQAFEDALDRLRAKLSIGGGETETVVRGRDGAHASAGASAARRRSAARAGVRRRPSSRS